MSPDSWKHASNYSQYLCRTQINFLSLILTDSWILVKMLEPNCLPGLSNCKIVKTTVQLLFSLFLQFSAIEIRSVFSHAKLKISWLKWLEKKKLECPSSLVSYRHFSTDRTQYQGKSAMLFIIVCLHWSWKAPMGRGQLSIHTYSIHTVYSIQFSMCACTSAR